MIKIISTSKSLLTLTVIDNLGTPRLINLMPGKYAYSTQKTIQLRNLELNREISMVNCPKGKGFSFGTAQVVNTSGARPASAPPAAVVAPVPTPTVEKQVAAKKKTTKPDTNVSVPTTSKDPVPDASTTVKEK